MTIFLLIQPEPELARPNGTDTENAAALQNNRKRRQVADEAIQQINPFVDFDCYSYPHRCYNITCTTGGLMAGSDQLDSINVIIKSRLWLETVKNVSLILKKYIILIVVQMTKVVMM